MPLLSKPTVPDHDCNEDGCSVCVECTHCIDGIEKDFMVIRGALADIRNEAETMQEIAEFSAGGGIYYFTFQSIIKKVDFLTGKDSSGKETRN